MLPKFASIVVGFCLLLNVGLGSPTPATGTKPFTPHVLPSERNELLITSLKPNSAEEVAGLVEGFGTVLYFDSIHQGFVVLVNEPFTLADALKRIKDNKRFKVSPKESGSIKLASEVKIDDDDDDSPEDMWQWYYNRRKNEHGVIDWASYSREIAHREHMPIGQFGRRNYTANLIEPAIPELTWSYIGPTNFSGIDRFGAGVGPVNGRINQVIYDPTNSSTIYAAAAEGGLFKSTDSGGTWTALSNSWAQLQCTSVSIDPTDHNVIYVGTGDYVGGYYGQDGAGSGYGRGIMKSADGGATWNSANDLAVQNSSSHAFGNSAVTKILISPEHHLTLIATTGRGESKAGGVYVSTDGGQSWQTMLTLGAGAYSDASMSLNDGTHARSYYVVRTSPTPAAYISTNEGATWGKMTLPALPATTGNVGIAATDYNVAYVLIDSVGAGSVWKTTNARPDSSGVSTWTNITGNLPTVAQGTLKFFDFDFYNFAIGAYKAPRTGGGTQDCLLIGNIDSFVSPNTDGNWTDLSHAYYTFTQTGLPSGNFHADQHNFSFNAAANEILIANDGGVTKVSLNPNDATFTYTQLNANLPIAEIWGLSVHPTMDWRVLAGLQDDGIVGTSYSSTSDADFANWFPGVNGGDGGSVAYYPPNPAIMYTGSASTGRVEETRDGGSHWAIITPIVNTKAYNGEAMGFVPPMVADGGSASLYFGTTHIWKYSIQNQTWSELPILIAPGANEVITAIAVAPSNSSVMYATTSFGHVVMSTNGGQGFNYIDGDLPWKGARNISAISVSPNNADDLLISSSSVGSRNMWHCLNTPGVHWVDCSGANGGSTDLLLTPVNDIARDFDTPDTTWYLATDLGVMMTADSGATWSNITQPMGLPNVQITKLIANANSRDLYAGTFGRGIWRIHDKSIPLTMSFSTNPVALGGQTFCTVNFTGPVPAPGYDIGLTTTDAVDTPLPAGNKMHAATGVTQQSFNINVPSNGTAHSVVVTANIGATKVSSVLTVIPPAISGNVLSSYSIYGGSEFPSWTVTIPYVAKGVVNLPAHSSNTAAVSLPKSTFSIPIGYQGDSMTLNTHAVAVDTNVTLSVAFTGGSSAVTLEVKPILVTSLVLSSNSAFGGTDNPGGSFVLNYVAPVVGGSNVAVVSSNPAAVSIDNKSPINVTPGYQGGSFAMTTHVVNIDTSVTISASLNGSTQTQVLLVKRNFPVSLTVDNGTPYGGTDSDNASVTLQTTAAVDKNAGATLALKSSNTVALTVPPTVFVTPGYQGTSFAFTPNPVTADSAVTITATLSGVSVTASVTVKRVAVTSVTLASPSGFGGVDTGSATVLLNTTANTPNGNNITLSSSVPSAATVPPTVNIISGYQATSFNITTSLTPKDTAVTISATLNGVTKTVIYTVKAVLVTSITFDLTTIYGGTENPTATVGLNDVAPPAGALVTLTSSVPAALSVSNLSIPGGYAASSQSTVSHVVSSDINVAITATYNGSSKVGVVTVKANRPAALSLNITSAYGGTDMPTATITLKDVATAGDQLLSMGSSDNTAASVPANTSVPSGYLSTSFPVTTKVISGAARSILISVACNGATISASLIVKPNGVTALTFDTMKPVGGINTPNGTVTLATTASAAGTGQPVIITSSDTNAATVPNVNVPTGYQAQSFPVFTKYVSTAHSVVITATANGVSKAVTIVVDTVPLSGLTLNPKLVTGSNPAIGTFTLGIAAGTTGVTVSLSSSNTAAATVPASVAVAANGTGGSFTITTLPVTTLTYVTITATAGTSKATAVLSVYPTILSGFTLAPSVVGGNNLAGTVNLNGRAFAGGMVVTLTSSNAAAAAVPASVTVAAGVTLATLPVTTSGVAASTLVTITGKNGTVTKTINLTVLPATLLSIAGAPSIKGGTAVNLTVNLNGKAGAARVVSLKSSNAVLLPVPATVTVAPQTTSFTFTVTSKAVTVATAITVTATDGAVSKTFTITLTP
jgi:hypothetical protein